MIPIKMNGFVVVDCKFRMSSIEHAYRQSAPDSYGVGMSMNGMAGGMGMGNYPGSQMLLYGRGMGGGGYGVS